MAERSSNSSANASRNARIYRERHEYSCVDCIGTLTDQVASKSNGVRARNSQGDGVLQNGTFTHLLVTRVWAGVNRPPPHGPRYLHVDIRLNGMVCTVDAAMMPFCPGRAQTMS